MVNINTLSKCISGDDKNFKNPKYFVFGIWYTLQF